MHNVALAAHESRGSENGPKTDDKRTDDLTTGENKDAPLAIRSLFFEELHVGMTQALSRTVSPSDVAAFAALTGDRNPIHLSDEYAAQTQFHRRIVHGAYTAGLISAVLGTRLPGPGAIYISQTLNFRAPVFVGDRIDVSVEIAELVPERRRARLACSCKVGGETVLDGEAWVKVPARA